MFLLSHYLFPAGWFSSRGVCAVRGPRRPRARAQPGQGPDPVRPRGRRFRLQQCRGPRVRALAAALRRPRDICAAFRSAGASPFHPPSGRPASRAATCNRRTAATASPLFALKNLSQFVLVILNVKKVQFVFAQIN